MRLRNPDRRGIEVVALMVAVLVVLVLALVTVDALHVH
jgi:Tfp pilus assembly protein PilE